MLHIYTGYGDIHLDMGDSVQGIYPPTENVCNTTDADIISKEQSTGTDIKMIQFETISSDSHSHWFV